MSLFDPTIDDQRLAIHGDDLAVPDALSEIFSQMPDVATLRQTARSLESPSPAELLMRTRWRLVQDAMTKSGLDREARLRVLMRATANAYADRSVYQPPQEVFEDELCGADPSLVQQVVEELLEVEDPNLGQQVKIGLAIVVSRRHRDTPEAWDARVPFKLSVELLREFLESLPAARRNARLAELIETEPLNRLNAFWRAELALEFVDLLDERHRAALQELADSIVSGEPDNDEDRAARLAAAMGEASSVEDDDWLERDEDGLTQYARNALQYWIDKIAAERMRNQLGPLAESRVDVALEVEAPELRTLSAWAAAAEERQIEIARAIEAAAGGFALSFVGLQTYDQDLPIAVFENEHTGMTLSLVPGGSYRRGFSEREERLVEAAGAADPDAGNWYETYQYIIDQADSMRPTQQVTVGPVLVFQIPSEPIEPAETTAMLEELPFRLLTEAEHEWVSRGGRESELTWRDDRVPDEDWMDEVFDGGVTLRNPFGLALLGMTPEALADVFEAGYEDAPTDGSARLGDGPRVVRGGAEMLYPWQACGEWQLLTNAMRTHATEWEFFLAIRPAIGVRLV